MRAWPLLLAVLTVVPTPSLAAGGEDPIAWGDPAFAGLEKLGGSPLRSPWTDMRERFRVPREAWEQKTGPERLALLRRAFSLYVIDLSNLESSGQEDRGIYDRVTPESVQEVKNTLGQESATEFAAVRSRLVVRRFDHDRVLVSQGLEWLDTFDPPRGARIRRELADLQARDQVKRENLGKAEAGEGRLGRSLGAPSDFGTKADNSGQREDLKEVPTVAVVAASGGSRERERKEPPAEGFSGERPSRPMVKTFSDAPPSFKVSKTEGKSLWEIEQARRDGIAWMVIGGALAVGGGFVATINPWAGGAMIVAGGGLAYYGYQKYDENTLTDEETRRLKAREDRRRGR